MSDETKEELVQEPEETIAHFIQRVVEKWENQGGTIVDGEVLAKLE